MHTSINTPIEAQAITANLQLSSCEGKNKQDHWIDPITLAYLDYGLFKSMCKLGVSRERVCSALNISYDDFDYIRTLSRA